jgi:hypothetical protein
MVPEHFCRESLARALDQIDEKAVSDVQRLNGIILRLAGIGSVTSKIYEIFDNVL